MSILNGAQLNLTKKGCFFLKSFHAFPAKSESTKSDGKRTALRREQRKLRGEGIKQSV
jgi:hypothetical protein